MSALRTDLWVAVSPTARLCPVAFQEGQQCESSQGNEVHMQSERESHHHRESGPTHTALSGSRGAPASMGKTWAHMAKAVKKMDILAKKVVTEPCRHSFISTSRAKSRGSSTDRCSDTAPV